MFALMDAVLCGLPKGLDIYKYKSYL